jgi:hypothetical protein
MSERISRAQVAKMLAVTEQMVLWLEKRKRLQDVTRDPQGLVSYSLDEVLVFKATYTKSASGPIRAGRRRGAAKPESATRSTLAAEVMRCLQKGMSLIDTVIATKADPAYVRRVWEEFKVPLEDTPKMRAQQKQEAERARVERQIEEERKQREEWDRRIELERVRRRGG